MRCICLGEALSDVLKRLTDDKNDINYVMVRLDGKHKPVARCTHDAILHNIYLIYIYVSTGKRGDKIAFDSEGSGGFSEMKSKIEESKFYFIALKVAGVDERSVSSNRSKYVVATYIGSDVG